MCYVVIFSYIAHVIFSMHEKILISIVHSMVLTFRLEQRPNVLCSTYFELVCAAFDAFLHGFEQYIILVLMLAVWVKIGKCIKGNFWLLLLLSLSELSFLFNSMITQRGTFLTEGDLLMGENYLWLKSLKYILILFCQVLKPNLIPILISKCILIDLLQELNSSFFLKS